MKEKLKKLSLVELESLYHLIDEGIYDGDNTQFLIQNCNSYSYGVACDKRMALLREIKIEIIAKINDIIL